MSSADITMPTSDGRTLWELILGWPSLRQRRIIARLRQQRALLRAQNARLRLENETLAAALVNTKSWVEASTATACSIAKSLGAKK